MNKPFINPRTLAVHFSGDQEESNDGTDDVVRDLDRDSDSVQPVSWLDFEESTPFRRLELACSEIEKWRGWLSRAELDMGRARDKSSLTTVGETTRLALHYLSADLDMASKKSRIRIGDCYKAWSRQQDADDA